MGAEGLLSFGWGEGGESEVGLRRPKQFEEQGGGSRIQLSRNEQRVVLCITQESDNNLQPKILQGTGSLIPAPRPAKLRSQS